MTHSWRLSTTRSATCISPQSDPRALLESGLRLKSPAHIKVFLENTDDSLVVAHATAGVREKLIDLRRRLRDSTTFAVPAAFRVAPSPPPPRPECCMRRDCRCGIDDVMDLDAAAEPMVPPSKKEKKPPAPRTCPDCKSARRDTEGHVYWQKGRREATHFYCSHPVCQKFKKGECPPTRAVPAVKKPQAPRSCPECNEAGRDTTGHAYRQKGTRKAMRFYCSHPACGRFEKGTEAAGV